MVGLPRLHGELGAKRVEVTARGAAGKEIGRVSLKTCQQQHVGFTRPVDEPNCPNTFELACFREEQPGLASHSHIADCRFPIGNWLMMKRPIGNRKLEIGNEL